MLKEVQKLIDRYPKLITVERDIENAVDILTNAYIKQGKLMLCGNGGSAADCQHIAGELLKRFKIKRGMNEEIRNNLRKYGVSEEYLSSICNGFPTISLVESVGFITAFMNDENIEYVYAQEINVVGNAGDVLIAISTSGDSINVVNAAIMAKAKNIKVIALTGESGGRLREYCDILINVPEIETARIQEYHLPIYHVICEAVERICLEE